MPNIKFTAEAADHGGKGPAVINMPEPQQFHRSGFSSSTLAMPTPDIPMGMQDDFNWDRFSEDGGDVDSDDEGAREVKGFWRMHPLVRALCIMVGGGILLIIPTIGVLASHRDLPFRTSLDRQAPNYQRDYSLQCLARSFALMTAMWVVGVFVYHLVDMAPDGVLRLWRTFKGKRGLEKLKDRLQFFVAIKLYIKMILMSAASLVSFVVMFPNASYRFSGRIENGQASWDQVLFQVNVLVLFACAIIAVEKLVLKIVATRFHRSAYKDRIDHQTYTSWVLDHLNRSRDVHGASAKNTPYMDASAASTFPGEKSGPVAATSRKELLASDEGDNDAPRGISDATTPPPLRQRLSSSGFWRNTFSGRRDKHRRTSSRGLASRLWNIRDMAMDGGIDMNSNQYAGRLARKLFSALHSERDYLVVDDFLPYFDKEEDAIRAFELFDRDGNGDISKREMRDRVVQIYKERRALLSALGDMSQVVGKLDLFMTVFALVVILVIALLVFGVEALKVLSTMGTLLVAWSFVFGNTFKTVFECVIFLFQVHPYDVGDTIVVVGESLTVHKMRLLSTVFFKTDGTYTVYPNNQLATMKIQNLRRSRPQSESIPVAFDFDTPADKIFALQERMNAFAEDNSRYFIAPVGFNVDLLENSNRIQISVGINYKNNWQDGGHRFDAKTRFAFALREAIRDLDMRYALPLQPVAMVPPPPGYDEARLDADGGEAHSGSTGSEGLRRRRTHGAQGSDDDDDDELFGTLPSPARPGYRQREYHGGISGAGSGGGNGSSGGGGGGGSVAMPAAAIAGTVIAGEM